MSERLSDDEWLKLLTRSVAETAEFNGRVLPAFPPDKMQMETVGQVGANAVKQAWGFVSGAIRQFERSPLFANPNKTLLDFGCSWGRISRCFLRDFAPGNITGLEVSSRYADVCRSIFPDIKVIKCDVFPPTPLTDASVDFIVGYSVFSHLSEAACAAWAMEFAALLKPGGRAVLTTRGRAYFDLHRRHIVKQFNVAPMFADYDAARAKYDRGEVVHSDTEAGRINRGHYSETFIPERYAAEKYQPLRLADFYDADGISVMVFEK